MILLLLSCSDDPKYFNSDPHIATHLITNKMLLSTVRKWCFLHRPATPTMLLKTFKFNGIRWKCTLSLGDSRRKWNNYLFNISSSRFIFNRSNSKDLYDATDSTTIQLEIVEGGHPTVQFISPSEGSSFAVDQKIPLLYSTTTKKIFQ